MSSLSVDADAGNAPTQAALGFGPAAPASRQVAMAAEDGAMLGAAEPLRRADALALALVSVAAGLVRVGQQAKARDDAAHAMAAEVTLARSAARARRRERRIAHEQAGRWRRRYTLQLHGDAVARRTHMRRDHLALLTGLDGGPVDPEDGYRRIGGDPYFALGDVVDGQGLWATVGQDDRRASLTRPAAEATTMLADEVEGRHRDHQTGFVAADGRSGCGGHRCRGGSRAVVGAGRAAEQREAGRHERREQQGKSQ